MTPIWVAYIDDIPTLSTVPHEVCEPEPLTSEQVVEMWDKLKKAYEKVMEYNALHPTQR